MREYHTVSRGWIINEIVRRVDPRQRTIGEFLRDEIATPLGIGNQVRVGIDPTDAQKNLNIAPLFICNPVWAILQSFVPTWMGRRVPWGARWCLGNLWKELQDKVFSRGDLPFEDPYKAEAAAVFPADKTSLIDDWNHPLMRSVEIPSANTHSRTTKNSDER